MLSVGKCFFLTMMQGLCEQQTMLVLRLSADHDSLYFSALLMGNTDDVFEERLIEALRGLMVFGVFNDSDIANDSVQRHIVCLIGFSVGFPKDEPSAIIFLQELGVEYQFKRLLSISLIGEPQHLPVCDGFIYHWQQINILSSP